MLTIIVRGLKNNERKTSMRTRPKDLGQSVHKVLEQGRNEENNNNRHWTDKTEWHDENRQFNLLPIL